MAQHGSVPQRLPGTTADNWLDPPYNAWGVWHLDQLVLHAVVSRGTGPVRALPPHPNPPELGSVEVTTPDGDPLSVAEVLDATHTDAFAVLQDGQLLWERYRFPGADRERHGVLSITKSVVGCVVGILVDRGELDLSHRVADHVPELRDSGYGDATVRQLLDMRSGARFVEDYTDPDSDISRLDQWLADRGLRAYLATVRKEREHGGHFLYRSAETDVLGWVCERATRKGMAELVSALVWAPMGAERDAVISCDATGMAVSDGGLAACARDLLRFGQLLLDQGAVPGDNGTVTQVVPARWVRDSWAVDSDIRQAFVDSPSESSLPGGWYRNQLWFRPGPYGDVMLCLGIHGQLLYVCRRTRTVCVKLSHWPAPQSPAHLQATLRACDAVAGRAGGALARPTVSGGAGVAARSRGTSSARRTGPPSPHRPPTPQGAT